jgi:hypothetical protein
MYTYKALLKKVQYKLWEIETYKISDKISNHIVVFGFTEGVTHFVKATRRKTDMPICFYSNENIYDEIFKINNIYGNIYHFYGDPFNKDHLDKVALPNAYCVVVMS